MKNAARIGITSVAMVLIVIFGIFGSAMAQTPTTVPLIAHIPKIVLEGRAKAMGPYNPDQMLRIVIGLKHPKLAEEEQFLRDVETRDSPLFHQFLTPEQWNERFAPSAQDEQAVVDWAKAQGLTLTQRYPNRLLVDVQAKVSTIQQAFNIAINTYMLGAESRFSNDRNPAIPANLASVIHSVSGLNNFQVLQPHHTNRKQVEYPIFAPGPAVGTSVSAGRNGDRTKRPSAVSANTRAITPKTTNGNYDPTDLYSSQAYDLSALDALGHCCNPLQNAGSSPRETSIAIPSVGGQNFADFAGFQTQYPYLAYNINEVGINGQAVPCTTSCDLEGTMDAEWSTAMANSFGSFADTAHVWIYDGPNSSISTFTDIFNRMLSDGAARVMSTSWGCGEFDCYSGADMDIQDGIFAAMSAQGWTLVAASGDQGATDGCFSHDAVDFPASDPHVVAVGGTTLSLDSFGKYISETASGGTFTGACAFSNGGSGGGFSAKYATPDYQSGMGFGSRAVPDTSLNANVFQNIYFNGALIGSGGTSIAAAEMAGFYAQSNAYLLSFGNICRFSLGGSPCAPQGDPHTYIYTFGNPTPTRYSFYDITSGCNSNDITAQFGLAFFCAGAGYDEVTGWGTVNMLQMAWATNLYNATTGGNMYSPGVIFSGPKVNQWYKTDQVVTFIASDSDNFPSTGVAGFTQGWDSIPSDSSQATPGSGNSFYSGPQFPNSTTGCLSFAGGFGCAGGAGQGMHTVHVEVWNNMGRATGYKYGPIGFDSIPPVTVASLSSTTTPVQVTLIASDNASGVASTVYQLDGGPAQNYAGPFAVTATGNHAVTFHSTDVATNVEANQVINWTEKASTSMALSSSLNPSAYSKPITFTAMVTSSKAGTITGTVTFKDGLTVLSTKTLSGGKAFFTDLSLTGGSHSITASYNGDTTYNSSTGSLTQTVTQASTSTTLASSLHPSVFGQAVTFTSSVTSTTPGVGGSVQFIDGTAILHTGSLSAGKATFTTSALATGAHSIKATFMGNTNFTTSTSSAISQTVSKASTKATMSSSVNPSVSGQLVKFTSTVGVVAPGMGTPTGNVTFKDGATVLGTVALLAGKATISTSTLTVGSHSITATYDVSANFNASTSSPLIQTIKVGTSTALVSSINPSALNQHVTFTATVKSATGTPTGTVTFKDGATTLATVTLSAGKAAFTTSSLTHGTHPMTAVYGGNFNYLGSTSPIATQKVN